MLNHNFYTDRELALLEKDYDPDSPQHLAASILGELSNIRLVGVPTEHVKHLGEISNLCWRTLKDEN